MDTIRKSFQVAAQAGKVLRCLTFARKIATVLCIGAAILGFIKMLTEIYHLAGKA